MKRYLTLLALLISLASFAKSVPAWDVPLIIKPASVYVTNYGAYKIGTKGAPDYAVRIQVQFNQSVPQPYYATVQVMGTWGGGGAYYRDFTVYFNTGQWNKSVDFPMAWNEEVYPATAGLSSYGPQ